MNGIYRYGTALINLVFQSPCPLCDRSAATAVCQGCQRQIQTQQYRSRHRFWYRTSGHGRALALPLFPWGQYSGALRQSLAALKYENQPRIAQLLGTWLAQAWLDAPETSGICRTTRLAIVPIPMHGDKRRQRGYDQAVLIAQQFCRITRLPLWRRGLIRERATQAQFSLSKTEREANLAGAFRPNPTLVRSRSSVLLIDDIYTTGATARAAALALQQTAPVRGLLAIAAAESDATR